MIICSALFYQGSLDEPQSLVRDNRFYPGKAHSTLPVWWAYLRRHYPDVPVVLFADAKSPVSIEPLLNTHLNQHWAGYQGDTPYLASRCRVHVKMLSAHSGKYFWPMQRNLVEAICLAYRANESLLWIDADCFCNTSATPLVAGYDFAAASIEHHQMTAASVFTYVSRDRLHALDSLGIDLPSFLTTMLNEGPTETRMHTLQEGGLYKLFAYGRTRQLGAQIELSHLSCYDHFLAFLRRNPLDTSEYRVLVAQLEGVDWSRLPGVARSFWDMDYGRHLA
jgi:hypothetical protein